MSGFMGCLVCRRPSRCHMQSKLSSPARTVLHGRQLWQRQTSCTGFTLPSVWRLHSQLLHGILAVNTQ